MNEEKKFYFFTIVLTTFTSVLVLAATIYTYSGFCILSGRSLW